MSRAKHQFIAIVIQYRKSSHPILPVCKGGFDDDPVLHAFPELIYFFGTFAIILVD